jgi:hypothetical protein
VLGHRANRADSVDHPVDASHGFEDGDPAAQQKEQGGLLTLPDQPIAGIEGQVRRARGDRIDLLW